MFFEKINLAMYFQYNVNVCVSAELGIQAVSVGDILVNHGKKKLLYGYLINLSLSYFSLM